MFRFLVTLILITVVSLTAFGSAAQAKPTLERVPFDVFEKLFPLDQSVWQRKADVLRGIEGSLVYLRSSDAAQDYDKFNEVGIDRSRVLQSLLRFRTLLFRAQSSEELTQMLRSEFMVVRTKGLDGDGAVRFTGYYQPIFKASLQKTGTFQFPLYKLPRGFFQWKKPHYTRVDLEGFDGLGSKTGMLSGYELAYLSSRYEVYLVQVQGSAILELQDGNKLAVGFAGATAHPFRGIPASFLRSPAVRGKNIQSYFDSHPKDLNNFLSQNNRFIFFKANPFKDPIGSLGVPVIAQRSIATDKREMPPGALALIHASFPVIKEEGGVHLSQKSYFVFDQDSGSAIKGPGRVDVFMGTGAQAGKLANSVSSTGGLYYLLLK